MGYFNEMSLDYPTDDDRLQDRRDDGLTSFVSAATPSRPQPPPCSPLPASLSAVMAHGTRF